MSDSLVVGMGQFLPSPPYTSLGTGTKYRDLGEEYKMHHKFIFFLQKGSEMASQKPMKS